LGRCFVQAAVARLLKEQAIADAAQSSANYLSFIRTKTGGTVQIEHGPPIIETA
jgi:hypothetical protein